VDAVGTKTHKYIFLNDERTQLYDILKHGPINCKTILLGTVLKNSKNFSKVAGKRGFSMDNCSTKYDPVYPFNYQYFTAITLHLSAVNLSRADDFVAYRNTICGSGSQATKILCTGKGWII